MDAASKTDKRRSQQNHVPSMQSLRALHAVARFGSTVRAAEHLNITPSAISHQLRKIEALLEVKLVRQTGRGISLTSAGVRYAKRIGEALDMIVDSSATLGGTEPQGTLSIHCSSGIATTWLCQRIGAFADLYPDIALSLLTADDRIDVYRNDVDFSIVYGDGNWPDMIVQLLYAPTFFPVCSPVLLDHMGEVSGPDDIANYRLLHHVDASDWAAWLAAAGATRVDITSGIVFNDINHSLAAAIAGHGIAMGDNGLVRQALRDGSLVRLFRHEIPGPKAYYLVSREEKRARLACAAGIAWVEAEFQALFDS